MAETKTISEIAINETQSRTEETPSDLLPPREAKGSYAVDDAVTAALPIAGSKVSHAILHGESLWGKTAKVVVDLPDGKTERYFLKVVSLPVLGKLMCESEYESLKAIAGACPGFAPKPHSWGKFSKGSGTYFLLAEFRDVGQQPADPGRLASRLAELHQKSVSPTGKFGFHFTTVHAANPQAVDFWTDSWCELYSSHLRKVINSAKPIMQWSEFDIVCDITLEKVVPRLLLPLQSDGRSIKPCLVHGDCWDGNTALDMRTGEAWVFDPCSFYGHNEYDIGDWRAPRHRLSDKAYVKAYKRQFPVSEPVEDWDARNLLYSLTFNICNAIYIPGSTQKQVVYEDMTTLCRMFFPAELEDRLAKHRRSQNGYPEPHVGQQEHANGDENEEEEEEEEELL